MNWDAIREVPDSFADRVEAGQLALGRWIEERKPERAAALDRIWSEIVHDPRFTSAPLAFQLDLLNRSGVALWWNGARSEALMRFNAALELCPPAWPDRARYLTNTAGVTLDRYMVEGGRDALDCAVRAAREAVERLTEISPLLALAAHNASRALSTRHRAYGDPADLEEGTEFATLSCDVAEQAGMSDLGVYQTQLSEVLTRRFDCYGRIDDLQRALAVCEQAFDSAETDHARVHVAGMLGRLLRSRWSVMGDRTDLDRAISLLQRRPPDDNPSTPARLTNLGSALLNRHELTGNATDLRDAVAAHEQAIALTSENDWQLASRHNNAGNSARSVYETTGQVASLQRAVDHYQRAVELTEATAPELASRQYNLGTALEIAVTVLNEDYAAQTHMAYRQACEAGLSRDLQWALGAARAWGEWAATTDRWTEAAEAYGYGLSAIDLLFRRQLQRDEKEVWLRRARGLAVDAAFALAAIGAPEPATLALERGRAFTLSESLEHNRADLSQLERQGLHRLARRYRAASRRVANSA
jgi:tetratricopeptide (TPR) repeat protein